LVTSSTSKWEFLLARASQNNPKWGPGHRLVYRHSPASHWYSLTCRGECCIGGDRDSSLTQHFVGTTICTGCPSCRGHDGEAILVRHWRHEALVQEDLSLVFLARDLLVYAWRCSLVYAPPASPISTLTLNGGARVTRVAPDWSWLFIDLRRAWRHPRTHPWWLRPL
jgi:hypothetical protein